MIIENPNESVIIREQGLAVICEPAPDGACFSNLFLALSTEKRVWEFNQLLRKGLNCNDSAPQWLHDVTDTLSGVPTVFNARADKQ
jgi:hypothetical protein